MAASLIHVSYLSFVSVVWSIVYENFVSLESFLLRLVTLVYDFIVFPHAYRDNFSTQVSAASVSQGLNSKYHFQNRLVASNQYQLFPILAYMRYTLTLALPDDRYPECTMSFSKMIYVHIAIVKSLMNGRFLICFSG